MKSSRLYLTALTIVILDQLTKYLIGRSLPVDTSIPIIGRLVYFTSVHNPGGAFGLFSSRTGALTVATVLVVVGMIIFSHSGFGLTSRATTGLALLLGGAVGNLIDRIRLGYVIDFIDLRYWPVFNVADVAVTAGIILMGYYLLIHHGHSSEAAKSPSGVASRDL